MQREKVVKGMIVEWDVAEKIHVSRMGVTTAVVNHVGPFTVVSHDEGMYFAVLAEDGSTQLMHCEWFRPVQAAAA